MMKFFEGEPFCEKNAVEIKEVVFREKFQI
jgi:hypothetical protein